MDENGDYYLPYGKRERMAQEKIEYIKETKTDVIPIEQLESIFIYRNNPSVQWVETPRHKQSNDPNVKVHCYVNKPYEELLFTSLKSPLDSSLLTKVYIEFRTGDRINKYQRNKIICPNKINSILIQQLNHRLIDLGYLSDVSRKKIIPEIRAALYEFQEDNLLTIGFVDEETLAALNIEY